MYRIYTFVETADEGKGTKTKKLVSYAGEVSSNQDLEMVKKTAMLHSDRLQGIMVDDQNKQQYFYGPGKGLKRVRELVEAVEDQVSRIAAGNM